MSRRVRSGVGDLVGSIIFIIFAIILASLFFGKNIERGQLLKVCSEKTVSSSVELTKTVNRTATEREEEYRHEDEAPVTVYDYLVEYRYIINGTEYKNMQYISESRYNTIEETKRIDNILYNPDDPSDSYIEGTIEEKDNSRQFILMGIFFIVVFFVVGVRALNCISVIKKGKARD